MSAPHPTAIDTADPAPLRLFRSPAPDLDEIADRYRANAARCIPIHDATPEVEPIAVNLDNLAREIRRNRLDEIAALVQKLTYGEMIELAAGIWAHRPTDSERPYADPLPITQEALPGILHRWSTND